MLFVTICALSVLMQVPRDARPPGEAAPPPAGTAIIRGQVTAADTGRPLRRAVVMLSGGPTPARAGAGTTGEADARAGRPVAFINRSIATNREGMFQFPGLPAGTYRLRVTAGLNRSHYLPLAFGARGPLDVGKAIDLGDGQTLQANFALVRGGAISGRVVDESGEPASRVTVAPLRVTAAGNAQRAGMSTSTDDLGAFRLYGLEPGDYVVMAETRQEGGPQPEGSAEGFAPTYFPSAVTDREAARIRVLTGRDSPDIDITLIRTRTFQISGTLIDSQGNIRRGGPISLMRASPAGLDFSGSVSFDAAGRFTIRNVVPGNYRLVVRPWDAMHVDDAKAKLPREFASVALSVEGNIDDLAVVTQPGVTVSGQIVFAEGPPATPPKSIRVGTEPGDQMPMWGSTDAEAGGDLRFTLRDLFGPYYIRAYGFPRGYFLKAIMLGGTDITDRPTEFRKEHSGHLQIVLTSRTSTLEGTVTDERGQAASEVSVLALPEDKASWRWGNSRMRITSASDGKFRLEGLLAGRYHVVAIPRDTLRPSRDLGPEVFEPFLKDATQVVVNEDETRAIELRMAKE